MVTRNRKEGVISDNVSYRQKKTKKNKTSPLIIIEKKSEGRQ